ncbi:MAG: alpha/beta hydrolase [Emcibacter sp.]|nr:alpha/beta hydrolase [Emcibacter sp.]
MMEKRNLQFSAPENAPLSESRRIAEIVREPFSSGGPEMQHVEEINISLPDGEVRIRLYYPSEERHLPGLFYLHGGGWVLFSLDTHDRLMREYAARANICVIGIDYSLAPEKKYPTQLQEIIGAITWCQENAERLGIDSSRLSIGGDSAGANLSMATALKLKADGKNDVLKALVLNYGVFDAACQMPSFEKYGNGELLLSNDEMKVFWDSYLDDKTLITSPFVSPIKADLTGLPATYMVIADHDVLYDENILMQEQLISSGVDVEAKVYEGTLHGFIESVCYGGIGEEAFKDTALWLKKIFKIS